MNKLLVNQISGINTLLTGVDEPLTKRQRQILNEVAAAPYEQNESYYYIFRSLSAKAAKLGCEIIKRKPFKQKNDLTAPVSAPLMISAARKSGWRAIHQQSGSNEDAKGI